MDKKKVQELLESALAENETLFLIDLSFFPNNKIQVVVDGDAGVSLSECVRISRAIEHNLDREEEDFSLEVTSPDITEPLKVKRQYVKNKSRTLKVKTADEVFEGILTEVNKDSIVLAWKTREPKPVGKGKITVEKTAVINYEDIREAKVKIIF
ncbi:MAG: ribosome assembly cofactor RimP [Flavobacteriaceae bacterium]|nr:ribosome assembly cofactor RimP [Flavobacteriaceae bacterium]